MAFDPQRSQKEALAREERLALLDQQRSQIAQIPDVGAADTARMRLRSDVGTSANGIGGGVENGPQWRAIARKFREMAFGFNTTFDGKGGGAQFSPDNPYITAGLKAKATAPGYEPGSLGEVALGRAANDALQFELATAALDEKFGRRSRPRAF